MATASTIGRGTTIRGNISGGGDLDILGHVEGSVGVGGHLLIGDSGTVRSDVNARTIIIRGAVLGNISADEFVILEAGARVVGDLRAPQVGIRAGALIRGNVATASSAAPAATRTRAAQAQKPAAMPRVQQQAAPVITRPAARPAQPAHTPHAKAEGAPPPVVPALRKGAKAQLRRKGAR